MTILIKKLRVILGCAVLIFIGSSQVSLAACTQWSSASDLASLPSWAGSFYNFFSSGFQMLVGSTCSANSTEVLTTISVGTPRGSTGPGNNSSTNTAPPIYTYRIAYVYIDGAWKETPLSPSPGTSAFSSNWYDGVATANVTLPLSVARNPHYFVGYTCQNINSTWKCGCRDASCTTRHWQLQKFTWTGSAAETDPTIGQRCTADSQCGSASACDAKTQTCILGHRGANAECFNNTDCGNAPAMCYAGGCYISCTLNSDCGSGAQCYQGRCI